MHLKKCLTKVSCLSLRTNGKYLAHGDAPNLCYAVAKRFGSVSHLVFKLVPKRKKHFFFRRIHYHCNSTHLCGDVHPNPGFGNTSETAEVFAGRKPPTWKHPCAVCSKPVHSNQKGILCDGCSNWHHTKCIGLDNRTYRMLSSFDDLWYCTNCSFPFNFTDSFFEEPIEHTTETGTKVGPDQLGPPVRVGSTRINSDRLGSSRIMKKKT